MTLTLNHDSLNLHLIRLGALHLESSPEPASGEEAAQFALLLKRNGLLPDTALLRRITEASAADLREAGLAVRAARDDHAALPRVNNWHTQDTRTPLMTRLLALLDVALTDGLDSCALHEGQAGRPCVEALDGLVNQGACAVCHRRVGDPDMLLSQAELTRLRRSDSQEPRQMLRLITGDLSAWASTHLTALAAQDRLLSEEEKSGLAQMCAALSPDDQRAVATQLGQMKLRTAESAALISGHLMRVCGDPALLCGLLWPDGRHGLMDVVRAVDVMGGGDGSLRRIHIPSLGRALRRAIKEAMTRTLEYKPEQRLTLTWELAQKRSGQVKRLMAKLHPHEKPGSTLAKFAALISTGGHLQGRNDPYVREGLETIIQMAGQAGQMRSLMSAVEVRLAEGDVTGAARQLAQRPGLLARTLLRLIRQAAPEDQAAVRQTLMDVAPRLGAAQLLTLRSVLVQAGMGGARVATTQSSGVSKVLDSHPALPGEISAPYLNAISGELRRRAAQLSPLSELHVDPSLLGVRLSASARHEQGGLASGSVLPLNAPDLKHLTLFTHWVEQNHGRVDLDLSVILLRDDSYAGTCSFRGAFPGASHSGDLTSAPAPVGATEFINLDLEQLRTRGVTRAVMVVNSYTGAAFQQCSNRSGVMVRRVVGTDYRDLEPSAVVARAEARGEGTGLIVAELHLEAGQERLIWHNLLSATTSVHTAEEVSSLLDVMVGSLAPQGISLLELAATHAVRTATVQCGAERLTRAGQSDEEWCLQVQHWLAGMSLQGAATQAPEAGLSLLRYAEEGSDTQFSLNADHERAGLTALIQQLDQR